MWIAFACLLGMVTTSFLVVTLQQSSPQHCWLVQTSSSWAKSVDTTLKKNYERQQSSHFEPIQAQSSPGWPCQRSSRSLLYGTLPSLHFGISILVLFPCLFHRCVKGRPAERGLVVHPAWLIPVHMHTHHSPVGSLWRWQMWRDICEAQMMHKLSAQRAPPLHLAKQHRAAEGPRSPCAGQQPHWGSPQSHSCRVPPSCHRCL